MDFEGTSRTQALFTQQHRKPPAALPSSREHPIMPSYRTQLSLFASLLVFSSTVVFSSTTLAQTPPRFPTRPVTIILPIAPGAAQDIETRLYVPRLNEGFGQPVLIDYKPGAGASLGTIYVAKAAPDGHTILAVTPGYTVYPAFFAPDKLPYDPNKDLAPVSLTNRRGAFLVVNTQLGVKTFPEFLAWVKANPEKLNYGTSGSGGILHIVGAWLHSATHTKATFIHYKGAGPMYTDLIAGRVDAASALTFVAAPHLKSGKMIALATMSAARSKVLPELRTLQEYGVTGYDYVSWSGILAPAKTPEAIVNRLSEEFARVARAPEVMKKMDDNGAEMVGSTPAQLHQVIATESARWRKIVTENGIRLEQ